MENEAHMELSYLEDHPEFIPVLAPPIVSHYESMDPEENIKSRTAKLRLHMNKNNLPIAWVAHSNAEVFGMAALRVHDLEGREDLTPWLAGVFVRSEHRRRGIASALCRVVEEKAWSMGFETLFLFTTDQQSLYSRLGWQLWQEGAWQGNRVDIMIKTRATAEPSRR
jgi:N-acetylglutamate synthase-like GNAT family acetyltransferase